MSTTMTWETFRAAAAALEAFQQHLIDTKHPYADEWNWAWDPAPTTSMLNRVFPGYGFLASRGNVRRYGAVSGGMRNLLNEDEGDDEEGFPGGDPCVVSTAIGAHSVFFYDFHVVFSPTYRAPVLFLRGTNLDGTILNPTQVQKHMSKHIDGAQFVSQDEHPVLGMPFFFLHPCDTAACLSLLADTTTASPSPLHLLLAWMSLVQPCTEIRIPMTAYVAMIDGGRANEDAISTAQNEPRPQKPPVGQVHCSVNIIAE
ncbi:Aste57867_8108 [Aphanomyces stellatus]|uniref:Ubiquitin-like-conjugating enzyme ATG10 n=1 Tax=Aphanomyces stellatus TaxID=120398 RepID=A0A485KJD9_9STRA|nr:hypothetical protein As57867_008078 [Aphanomyces stellatus]VFT84997.1 Aste57867_8108 [Aphanomyces stellatus]